MRDALSDLLQAETRYAPVVDARGAIAGVLSVEIISEFLTSERGAHGRAPRRRAPARRGRLMIAALATLLPLAQAGGFVREPGQGATSCVGRTTRSASTTSGTTSATT